MVAGCTLQVASSEPWLLQAALSELPFEPAASAGERPLRLTVETLPLAPPPPEPLLPGALLPGYLWRGAELWLRAGGGGEFYADADRGEARVSIPTSQRDRAPEELGAGMGLILSHLLRGRELWTVHASAVAGPAGAVVIPGVSGSGKSTSAAALCADPRFRMLADDRVLLRGPAGYVLGLGGRARLRPPASAWLPTAEAPAQTEPVRAALLLFPCIEEGSPLALSPLSRLEALKRLLRCSVAPGPPETVRRHLAAVTDLVRSVPAFHLRLGRDLRQLPERVFALLAHPEDRG